MQSVVQSISDLKLNINISIPARELQSEYSKKIEEVAKQARVDGFRVGKVPVAYIKKHYGKGIEAEVVDTIVRKSFDKFCTEKKLDIAGIENVDVTQKELGKDLEFTVSVEIYPEISFSDNDFLKASVIKKTVELSNTVLDENFEKFLKSYAEWENVTDLNTSAKMGDKVIIDFEGSMDSKVVDSAAAKDFELELGSNHLIPGFEDGIVGHKAGEEFEIKLTFPSDYHEADYASKEITFKINLKTVRHAVLPEVNKEFCQRFGIGVGSNHNHVHDEHCDHDHDSASASHEIEINDDADFPALLKEKLKESLNKELTNRVHQDYKESVLAALREVKPINIPRSAIEVEINNMVKERQEQYKKYTGKNNKLSIDRSKLEEDARKRVHTSLIVLAYIKQHDLKVDREMIRAKLSELMGTNNVSNEILDMYYDQPKMQELRAIALEDLVITHLSNKFTVVETAVDYDKFEK
ncbi:MAG: trigger factor [Gammaproteobacteria bacterium]|nr:trigger factor [Gammaproteobacteria bacterium]